MELALIVTWIFNMILWGSLFNLCVKLEKRIMRLELAAKQTND